MSWCRSYNISRDNGIYNVFFQEVILDSISVKDLDRKSRQRRKPRHCCSRQVIYGEITRLVCLRNICIKLLYLHESNGESRWCYQMISWPPANDMIRVAPLFPGAEAGTALIFWQGCEVAFGIKAPINQHGAKSLDHISQGKEKSLSPPAGQRSQSTKAVESHKEIKRKIK